MTALPGARLRPSSTAETDDERLAAVAAPVHDPLWILARQYQTGGFFAEDGGPPVTVTMAHVTGDLVVDGSPARGQLEPHVEAEPKSGGELVDTAARVRLASELFRLLTDSGTNREDVSAIRARLADAYPLSTRGETGGLTAYTGHLPDAVQMYTEWRGPLGTSAGSLPTIPGLDPAHRTALEPAARTWVGWMHGRVGDGPGVRPPAWNDQQLGYAFDGSALLGGQGLTLTTDDYDGGGLDWHTFDRSPLAAPPSPGPAMVVRPTRVSYPGMPEPSFWTIEDGNVNLDALATTDPARSLLVAFAHQYANDWFLVPLPLSPGVVLVTDLTIVDSFGTTTTVRPSAAVDGPAARFRLWEVAVDPADPNPDAGLGLRVLLPSAPPPLEGPPLEDVVLARDELANLGWLIELTTTDGDGMPVDRYRRWLAARPPEPVGSAVTEGTARYRLGTTVPDHWYPFEAAEIGADGHRGLRLAELPEGASEVPDAGVRGVTVDHAPGTAVDEEVVSRAGTRVRRVDRLTYTPSGPVVWRARRSDAGTGEATSGLRFDVIEAPR